MDEPTFRAIPILRIFDVAKAFYIDFLGFRTHWERRFKDGAPVYMQTTRGDLVLRFGEHHGDCCPGATVYVRAAPCGPASREHGQGLAVHAPRPRAHALALQADGGRRPDQQPAQVRPATRTITE